MNRLKVYEADVFDYETKSRRIVAVAAPNRKEAVACFNGRDMNGRGYTGRIRILDDPDHSALTAGAGVVMAQRDGEWIRLVSGPFTFDGGREAVAAIEPILTDLGFEPVSPGVYAKLPERRWWRRTDGTLVVFYSPMSGLGPRLSVSGDGLWTGCPWDEWDKLPATIARVEEHMAHMAKVEDELARRAEG